MGDRIVLAIFFIIFVILRNYKIGGYVMIFIGIALVILALFGGLKGHSVNK